MHVLAKLIEVYDVVEKRKTCQGQQLSSLTWFNSRLKAMQKSDALQIL